MEEEKVRVTQQLLGDAVQHGEVKKDLSDRKQHTQGERRMILKEKIWALAMKEKANRADLELAAKTEGLLPTSKKEREEVVSIDDEILKRHEQSI